MRCLMINVCVAAGEIISNRHVMFQCEQQSAYRLSSAGQPAVLAHSILFVIFCFRLTVVDNAQYRSWWVTLLSYFS